METLIYRSHQLLMIFPEIYIYYSAQRVFNASKCLLTFNKTFLPFFGIEAFTVIKR